MIRNFSKREVEYMKEVKTIFEKFSHLGSISSFVQLFRKFSSLFENNQLIKDADRESAIIHIKVDEKNYLMENKRLIQTDHIPDKANLIIFSKDTLIKTNRLTGINDKSELEQLVKQLRKNKNLENYQKILDVLPESFKTNMTIRQFMKVLTKSKVTK